MSNLEQIIPIFFSWAAIVLSALALSRVTRLDDGTSETFAAVGADVGNHERRLEQLEEETGIETYPSPSAIDMRLNDPDFQDYSGYYSDEEFTAATGEAP